MSYRGGGGLFVMRWTTGGMRAMLGKYSGRSEKLKEGASWLRWAAGKIRERFWVMAAGGSGEVVCWSRRAGRGQVESRCVARIRLVAGRRKGYRIRLMVSRCRCKGYSGGGEGALVEQRRSPFFSLGCQSCRNELCFIVLDYRYSFDYSKWRLGILYFQRQMWDRCPK